MNAWRPSNLDALVEQALERANDPAPASAGGDNGALQDEDFARMAAAFSEARPDPSRSRTR